MVEPICEELRRCIALGEPSVEDHLRVKDHLRTCDACRLEAGRLGRVIGSLGVEAWVEVPRGIDATLREAIRSGPARRPAILRPPAAIGVASAALLSLVGGVAIPLAQTRLGMFAPVAAVLLMLVYMTSVTAVMMPLLLRGARSSGGRRWM